MKYLYPYECEKLKLSSPQELQSAIDGNRREGRRPSYGSFDLSPGPTLLPQSPHLNGSMMNGRPNTGSPPYSTGVCDVSCVIYLFVCVFYHVCYSRPGTAPQKVVTLRKYEALMWCVSSVEGAI